MKDKIIGIDIGSSSCKIGVFDIYGQPQMILNKNTSVSAQNKKTAIREYDPEIWWESTAEALKEITATIPKNSIKAIGLAGQIGTHMFMDSNMEQLIPCISWQDNRAIKESKWYNSTYSPEQMMKELGMHLPPGVAWPIPRLLWLKNNRPELFKSGFRMLQAKDYIGYKLTGKLKTDVLSLRGLVNPYTMNISDLVEHEILKVSDIRQYIPEYCDSPTEILGSITDTVHEITGLQNGLPVITGCGDFHASLLGTGITDETTGFNITGTSDHIGILETEEKVFNTFQVGKYPSAIKGTNIIYGATSAGGGSVDWFIKTLSKKNQGESLQEYLKNEYIKTSNSNGLIFLPYINGERAPIWDSEANGTFMGITSSHTSAHFLYAVLEGVAFSLRHNWEFISRDRNKVKCIRVSGAAARDSVWNRIKSNILKTPIQTVICNETSCLGAAITASVGIGVYKDLNEAISNMVHTEKIIEPDPSTYSYYDKMFSEYKKLQESTKEMSHRLNRIRGEI